MIDKVLKAVMLIFLLASCVLGQGHIWTRTDYDSSYITRTVGDSLYLNEVEDDSLYTTPDEAAAIADSLIADSLAAENFISHIRGWQFATYYSAPATSYDYGDSLFFVYLTDTTTLYHYIEVPLRMFGSDDMYFDSVEVRINGNATSSINEFAIGQLAMNDAFAVLLNKMDDQSCNGSDQVITYTFSTAPTLTGGALAFRVKVNVPSGDEVRIYSYRLYYRIE